MLPLGIWCFISYAPFIWHPDIKLSLPVQKEGSTTVYVAGDHVGKAFFQELQEAIRNDNEAIGALHASGEFPGSASSRRRANVKQLRQISQLALSHHWISEDESRDSSALYRVWKDIAEGTLVPKSPPLSEENLALVKKNWSLLSAGGNAYDKETFVDIPLFKLVPQGKPSNPDYLPEPHLALLSGIDAFTKKSDDQASMAERTAHSVKIVFSGFLLSCLIGVPIGVLCGSVAFFSKLVEPFVDFFRYMPAPTFSTLLVAIFLANDAPKIALVVIGTVFQMVLVIAKTTRLLDRSLLEAAQTLGASQKQLLFKVITPGIMPNLYNDLRILLGWAWTWLVIAELIGVKSGLTEFIETQGRWRNFDNVYPIIILIGIIGYFTDQVLAWIRRPLFPWLGEPMGPTAKAIVSLAPWRRRQTSSAARKPQTNET